MRISAVVFVSVTLAGVASAQAPAHVSRAETLFQEGRQLVREGRYAEACPKLEESQRLDPAPGTRLNLADCWEHAGRTASAQREFLAVAESSEKSGEKERAAIARARAKQLENRVTSLALLVPPEARLPGLQLFQNSLPVSEAEWGTARPVDPGSFVIEARAPGRRGYRSAFALRADGAVHNLTIPKLVEENALVVTPAEDTVATKGQWLERAGIGLAGLGVIGIAAGTVLGVRAVSLYHRSQDEGCDARDVCPSDALETRRSAIHTGNASSVSFVVGGVLLAGGAGLYVWGTRERSRERASLSASVAPLEGGAFASVASRF